MALAANTTHVAISLSPGWMSRHLEHIGFVSQFLAAANKARLGHRLDYAVLMSACAKSPHLNSDNSAKTFAQGEFRLRRAARLND
jgi:hypothetical protein